MKIKVAKDYLLDQLIYESDKKFCREYEYYWGSPPKTFKSDYSSNWIEEDVSIDKLMEYIHEGYAIKINC